MAVTAIDANSIVVAGYRFTASVMFGSRLQPALWPETDIASYTEAAESLIRHLAPLGGIVLLGTGPTLVFPPIEARRRWAQAGLAVEVMDTSAACRTFNLLVGEGREVHAAVLIGHHWPAT